MDVPGGFDALHMDDRLKEQYIRTLGQLSALLDTGSPAHCATPQSPALPAPSPPSSSRSPLADRTNAGVQTKPLESQNPLAASVCLTPEASSRPPLANRTNAGVQTKPLESQDRQAAAAMCLTPEASQRHSSGGSTPRVSSDKKRFRRRPSTSSGEAGGLMSPPLPPLQQHDLHGASRRDSQGCQQLHMRQGCVAGAEQDQHGMQQKPGLRQPAAVRKPVPAAPAPDVTAEYAVPARRAFPAVHAVPAGRAAPVPAPAGVGPQYNALGSCSPAHHCSHHQHTINATTLPLPPLHHLSDGAALQQGQSSQPRPNPNIGSGGHHLPPPFVDQPPASTSRGHTPSRMRRSGFVIYKEDSALNTVTPQPGCSARAHGGVQYADVGAIDSPPSTPSPPQPTPPAKVTPPAPPLSPPATSPSSPPSDTLHEMHPLSPLRLSAALLAATDLPACNATFQQEDGPSSSSLADHHYQQQHAQLLNPASMPPSDQHCSTMAGPVRDEGSAQQHREQWGRLPQLLHHHHQHHQQQQQHYHHHQQQQQQYHDLHPHQQQQQQQQWDEERSATAWDPGMGLDPRTLQHLEQPSWLAADQSAHGLGCGDESCWLEADGQQGAKHSIWHANQQQGADDTAWHTVLREGVQNMIRHAGQQQGTEDSSWHTNQQEWGKLPQQLRSAQADQWQQLDWQGCMSRVQDQGKHQEGAEALQQPDLQQQYQQQEWAEALQQPDLWQQQQQQQNWAAGTQQPNLQQHQRQLECTETLQQQEWAEALQQEEWAEAPQQPDLQQQHQQQQNWALGTQQPDLQQQHQHQQQEHAEVLASPVPATGTPPAGKGARKGVASRGSVSSSLSPTPQQQPRDGGSSDSCSSGPKDSSDFTPLRPLSVPALQGGRDEGKHDHEGEHWHKGETQMAPGCAAHSDHGCSSDASSSDFSSLRPRGEPAQQGSQDEGMPDHVHEHAHNPDHVGKRAHNGETQMAPRCAGHSDHENCSSDASSRHSSSDASYWIRRACNPGLPRHLQQQREQQRRGLSQLLPQEQQQQQQLTQHPRKAGPPHARLSSHQQRQQRRQKEQQQAGPGLQFQPSDPSDPLDWPRRWQKKQQQHAGRWPRRALGCVHSRPASAAGSPGKQAKARKLSASTLAALDAHTATSVPPQWQHSTQQAQCLHVASSVHLHCQHAPQHIPQRLHTGSTLDAHTAALNAHAVPSQPVLGARGVGWGVELHHEQPTALGAQMAPGQTVLGQRAVGVELQQERPACLPDQIQPCQQHQHIQLPSAASADTAAADGVQQPYSAVQLQHAQQGTVGAPEQQVLGPQQQQQQPAQEPLSTLVQQLVLALQQQQQQQQQPYPSAPHPGLWGRRRSARDHVRHARGLMRMHSMHKRAMAASISSSLFLKTPAPRMTRACQTADGDAGSSPAATVAAAPLLTVASPALHWASQTPCSRNPADGPQLDHTPDHAPGHAVDATAAFCSAQHSAPAHSNGVHHTSSPPCGSPLHPHLSSLVPCAASPQVSSSDLHGPAWDPLLAQPGSITQPIQQALLQAQQISPVSSAAPPSADVSVSLNAPLNAPCTPSGTLSSTPHSATCRACLLPNIIQPPQHPDSSQAQQVTPASSAAPLSAHWSAPYTPSNMLSSTPNSAACQASPMPTSPPTPNLLCEPHTHTPLHTASHPKPAAVHCTHLPPKLRTIPHPPAAVAGPSAGAVRHTHLPPSLHTSSHLSPAAAVHHTHLPPSLCTSSHLPPAAAAAAAAVHPAVRHAPPTPSLHTASNPLAAPRSAASTVHSPISHNPPQPLHSSQALCAAHSHAQFEQQGAASGSSQASCTAPLQAQSKQQGAHTSPDASTLRQLLAQLTRALHGLHSQYAAASTMSNSCHQQHTCNTPSSSNNHHRQQQACSGTSSSSSDHLEQRACSNSGNSHHQQQPCSKTCLPASNSSGSSNSGSNAQGHEVCQRQQQQQQQLLGGGRQEKPHSCSTPLGAFAEHAIQTAHPGIPMAASPCHNPQPPQDCAFVAADQSNLACQPQAVQLTQPAAQNPTQQPQVVQPAQPAAHPTQKPQAVQLAQPTPHLSQPSMLSQQPTIPANHPNHPSSCPQQIHAGLAAAQHSSLPPPIPANHPNRLSSYQQKNHAGLAAAQRSSLPPPIPANHPNRPSNCPQQSQPHFSVPMQPTTPPWPLQPSPPIMQLQIPQLQSPHQQHQDQQLRSMPHPQDSLQQSRQQPLTAGVQNAAAFPASKSSRQAELSVQPLLCTPGPNSLGMQLPAHAHGHDHLGTQQPCVVSEPQLGPTTGFTAEAGCVPSQHTQSAAQNSAQNTIHAAQPAAAPGTVININTQPQPQPQHCLHDHRNCSCRYCHCHPPCCPCQQAPPACSALTLDSHGSCLPIEPSTPPPMTHDRHTSRCPAIHLVHCLHHPAPAVRPPPPVLPMCTCQGGGCCCGGCARLMGEEHAPLRPLHQDCYKEAPGAQHSSLACTTEPLGGGAPNAAQHSRPTRSTAPYLACSTGAPGAQHSSLGQASAVEEVQRSQEQRHQQQQQQQQQERPWVGPSLVASHLQKRCLDASRMPVKHASPADVQSIHGRALDLSHGRLQRLVAELAPHA